tara:strand:- start:7234 stop:8919 length:1686 start_codon:yes stop_codon:yes gene_type:complete
MSEMEIEPTGGSTAPSGSFPPDLFELASDVAMVGAPPSDAIATQIFQMHPLPSVFAALAEAEEGSKAESDLCSFLDRMFQTGPAQTLLPSVLPYAEQGLDSSSPRVRQLACRSLLRCAHQVACLPSLDELDGYVGGLVEAISDVDAGVAASAHDAIVSIAEVDTNTSIAILQKVKAMFADGERTKSAETRLRRHALAAAVASTSPTAFDCSTTLGLPELLLNELDSKNDPLASIATMELLCEIVEKQPTSRVSLALCDATLPKLAGVARSDSQGAASGFAKARALTVGARLCASISTARGTFPSTTGGDSLLDALRGALQLAVAGDGDKESGEVACVAVGALCESGYATSAHAMLELVTLVMHLALGGTRVPTGTRVAALHAAATLMGAGETSGRRTLLVSPKAPHEPCGSTNETSAAIETAMREAAYDASAARAMTVGESIKEVIAKGTDSYLELRVAAYRFVASAGRRNWFAFETLSCEKVVALVTDASWENLAPGCRWRHEAVCGLLVGARDNSGSTGEGVRVSDGAMSRLESAVAGGPFGGGANGSGVVPQVAVAQR